MNIKPCSPRRHFSENNSSHLTHQRTLDADVKQSMVTNASTLGRQVNQQEDVASIKRLERTPPQRFDTKTEEKQASVPLDGESQEQLFSNFVTTMLDTLGKEEGVKITEEAREKALESKAQNVEPFVAVLALNVANRRMKEMRPGASRKELRQEAKRDSHLDRLLKLSDSATSYLKAVKKNESLEKNGRGVSRDQDSGSDSKSCEGYLLVPEKQAKMMADNHQSMLKLAELHEKMRAQNLATMEAIRQIWEKTNVEINELRLETRKRQEAYRAKHFQAFLDILRAPDC